MEVMRRLAFESVLRACSFASLAIFCVMIGLSFEPRAAFQAGAMLTLLMAAVLMLKAYGARTKHYRKTEMWLYLSDEQRPPDAYAQRMTSAVMQQTYLTFARWTATIAVVLGLLWLVASIAEKWL
jgi:hypothetical protein